ncbi:uncharacterized protein LOC111265335 [Varroa jacobsoni]|uniref:Uncharacterized protein n=1 Tax=Varroa destructor TaxID=109461 RepID=A0A7M7KBL7_VARDE|nr:uncharacterized protein LOC111251251 [Varroa destructor]XP_022697669.1 uncharacterized protein LOC111265335 [Varroa jacobsoni]
MNLYQLITGGLNEVKEEIANEREHRVHLERRITVLERRTTLKWSVLVVLLSLLINSAMVAQKVPQIADNTIVTNFTFSLHDSWLNYILQKWRPIHLEQKRHFSTWDITWYIKGVLEKGSGRETFNLTITAVPSGRLSRIMPEIQVLFLDEDGQPLMTETGFTPYPFNVSGNSGVKNITSSPESTSLVPLVRSIDILGLRKMNFIKESIGVALYIRRSK